MSAPFRSRARTAAVRVLLAGLPLAAACSDSGTGNDLRQPDDLPLPKGTVAVLHCTAQVASGSVTCEPGTPPGAQTQKNGPRANLHIVGGQGTYVRLTSSANAYNAGTEVLSFDVTVQNLTTLAFGTADGATRHADGVRVFFAAPPAITVGSGDPVTVLNHTGTADYTATGQAYFQYGGAIGGVDQGELGADGILATSEVSATRNWQMHVDNTVTTFTFQLYVAAETPAGAVASAAPQVNSVSPATLVPGSVATLTGLNFNATPGNNAVTIGGRAATVTGGNATELQVMVPCVASGSVAVQVTQGGMKGAALSHPLQVAQRTLAVGEALVLPSSTDSQCNELAPTGGAARYVVTVFSVNPSPGSNAPFQFSADGDLAAPAQLQAAPATERVVAPRLTLEEQMEAARQRVADEKHYRLLEQNRVENERLRAHFGTRTSPAEMRARRLNRNVVMGDPPLTRTFRVPNINGSFCNSFYVVSATRVYFNGKIAIYEDDATPDAFKSSLNATMASNYLKIGDQFNTDMEPVIRNNFGDVLRRDAVTDNNGVQIALFTPRINNSFSGVAGYVVSCDQYPNDDSGTPAVGGPYTGSGTNGSSNFGEYFYAYQPVTPGSGYSGNTAENWYRSVRSTFIHETKHVASMAARVANGAPLEAGWLEEGTARHSEELWMRNAVDNVAWKANTGYGSAGNPVNVYCDVRVPPSWAECNANPRRPASIMSRHFQTLNTHLRDQNARLLSPFGPSPEDTGSYYYAIAWSLIRYAIDRYGASDAAFLTALNNSNTTGVTNLSDRAGVPITQLVGGWGLTLYADDYPGLGSPNPDIQFPTWNLRNIYAGLNTDFPGTYTSPFMLVPTPLPFGGVATLATGTMRGGGTRYYEFSGTHSAAQLLRLEANGGGTPSTNLRLAVARLQ